MPSNTIPREGGRGGVRLLDPPHPQEPADADAPAPPAVADQEGPAVGSGGGPSSAGGTEALPRLDAKSASGSDADEETRRWMFVQSFGDDSAGADDLVTAMAVSPDGDWLAAGDEAGRICLFECGAAQPQPQPLRADAPTPGSDFDHDMGGEPAPTPRDSVAYGFHYEFQSHESAFDTLRSFAIGPRIRQVRWFPQYGSGRSQFVLSTNVREVRLWKVYGRADSRNAVCKRSFALAHDYDINSLSVCADGETFLTADDLRLNLWNAEIGGTAFNALDLKPSSLDDLAEVVTTAAFHQTDSSLLAVATSGGSVGVHDLRSRARLSAPSAGSVRNACPVAGGDEAYAAVAASVSHAEFVPGASGAGGWTLCTRDFSAVKMWDARRSDRPVSVRAVHPYLAPYLPDMYENQCLFDPFTAGVSPDGKSTVTGSYNNQFVVHDADTAAPSTTIIARDEDEGVCTLVGPQPDALSLDLARKSLHTLWHPTRDAVIVAAVNKIYVYERS